MTNHHEATVQACWNAINALIVEGPLKGDGWDETATRNGIVLAANVLAEMLDRFGGEGSPGDVKPAASFDLIPHLRRQAEFSQRTFGPGKRVEGVTDHIAKELQEVRDSGGALAEWIDVIILGFDGAWRSGATPEEIVAAMVAKQTKNEGRSWPDWRTAVPGKAIEHKRDAEV
jgi:hypothetical protein